MMQLSLRLYNEGRFANETANVTKPIIRIDSDYRDYVYWTNLAIQFIGNQMEPTATN